jgi:hypothetical protein
MPVNHGMLYNLSQRYDSVTTSQLHGCVFFFFPCGVSSFSQMTIFSIDQSLCKNGTRLVGAFCCHGLLSLLEEDVDQLPSTADVTVHRQNVSNRACLRVGTYLQ